MPRALKYKEEEDNEVYSQTARGYIEELILTLINCDNAKKNLHFKYVSPEWIGAPGWYFWPKEREGVYFLKLVDARPQKEVIKSILHVYYYPHPQEEVFWHYSFVEQLTRLSHVFQGSIPGHSEACPCHSDHEHHDFADLQEGLGIPVPQFRGEINPWLYRLGELSCLWDKGILKHLSIEAQARSQTWSCTNLYGEGMNGAILYEIDRDLPAWDLVKEFSTGFLEDLKTIGFLLSPEEAFDITGNSGMNSMGFKLGLTPPSIRGR